jgi:hypothetical protein
MARKNKTAPRPRRTLSPRTCVMEHKSCRDRPSLASCRARPRGPFLPFPFTPHDRHTHTPILDGSEAAACYSIALTPTQRAARGVSTTVQHSHRFSVTFAPLSKTLPFSVAPGDEGGRGIPHCCFHDAAVMFHTNDGTRRGAVGPSPSQWHPRRR